MNLESEVDLEEVTLQDCMEMYFFKGMTSRGMTLPRTQPRAEPKRQCRFAIIISVWSGNVKT